MDEQTVREAAEIHARATVDRDYPTAGSYLGDGMMDAAGAVMKEMPRPLTGSEVTYVEETEGGYTCRIRYTGESGATDVDSHWAEMDGSPTIVGLEVVEKS